VSRPDEGDVLRHPGVASVDGADRTEAATAVDVNLLSSVDEEARTASVSHRDRAVEDPNVARDNGEAGDRKARSSHRGDRVRGLDLEAGTTPCEVLDAVERLADIEPPDDLPPVRLLQRLERVGRVRAQPCQGTVEIADLGSAGGVGADALPGAERGAVGSGRELRLR